MREVFVKALWIVLGGLVMAGPAMAENWSQTWTSNSDKQDFAYALLERTDEGGTLVINGTENDRNAVLKLRDRSDGTFVWIRNGKTRYVVRDAASIAKAREILAPELELAKTSGEIGKLQGGLGHAQSTVGVEQGHIGVRQGQIGVRLAQIGLERIGLEPKSSRAKELDREEEELQEEMEQLSRAQENLGETQSRMGQDLSKLGEMQSKRAEAHEDVYAKVRTDMKHYLRDAIGNGTARPI
jgi:hypothetical protein